MHAREEWLDAVLPVVERGAGRAFPMPPALGEDDVSGFLRPYGGARPMPGARDGGPGEEGMPVATPGGRGPAPATTRASTSPTPPSCRAYGSIARRPRPPGRNGRPAG
ncbi:hypothetical protein GCM10017667_70350 [Streptomyces filamentosus]|uniref:Uncharacterized protein n=1 Tax=Streptomyces filamentosus TaxID=67294 RepID=A0A919ESA0_STRFL|nr:hypothetical protein GCM10017667_70350 [Streptomyces filamentosus]